MKTYVSTALLAFCLYPLPAQAQVLVEPDQSGITVDNEGFEALHLMRSVQQFGSGWTVEDNVGNSYPLLGYEARNTSRGGDDPDDEPIVVIGGYQSVGEEVPEAIVSGYRKVLDILRNEYGAVVTSDPVLGVDLVSFPNEEDPIHRFFEIITTRTLPIEVMGKDPYEAPYYVFFRMLEFASSGVFGPGPYEAAQPVGRPPLFLNDPYVLNQWNLVWTHLGMAHWHPATPQKAVRISLIDSGIGAAQQGHAGLDGTRVDHVSVAPTTGQPVAHGLGVASLLGDRSNDGDGIVGALGDAWEGSCYSEAALLAKAPPQIFSYNAGDFGPVSLYVARAIRESIAQEVDVINLSLALAYSPLVEAAIEEALAQNIIVIAAAGNYAPGAAAKPAKWPANMDGVIAVGSAARNAGFSAFSANSGVDILAPGEAIVVGGPDGVWYEAEGTSFAAPHVTAAAAMMRAVNPDLTPAGVLEALQAGAWAKQENGVGLLHAWNALNHVLPQAGRSRGVSFPYRCIAGLARGSGLAGLQASAEAVQAGVEALWNVAAYDGAADEDLLEAAQPDASPAGMPEHAALVGNHPNPFNPQTTLRFYLPEAQHVRLAVFNVLGQEVQVLADGRFEAGQHDVRFQARELPSGLYLARLETASGTEVRTMMLMK